MSDVNVIDTDARQSQIEGEMKAAGVSSSTPVQADYFAFEQQFKVMLPDGISFITHKKMNEGDRRRYLDATNRDVRVEKVTQDMRIKMEPGKERHVLLEAAIIGWNLRRNGEELTFSKGSPGSTLSQFLASTDPSIIDIIEKDIRKHNPWLLAEMSSDDIRKQISDLEEMLEVKIKEEESGNS